MEPAWYYAADGQTHGPLDEAALRAALPTLQGGETLVYGPGFSEWRRAADVFQTLPVPQTVLPPPVFAAPSSPAPVGQPGQFAGVAALAVVEAPQRRGATGVIVLAACIGFVLAVGVGLWVVTAVSDAIVGVEGPDRADPGRHDSAGLAFDYPGDWAIDTLRDDYDPDTSVFIEPIVDAMARVQVYPSEKTLGEELAATLEGYRDGADDWLVELEFASWGRYRGEGKSVAVSYGGLAYRLRVFVGRVQPGTYLEIHEMWDLGEEQTLRDGYELIEGSLVVK